MAEVKKGIQIPEMRRDMVKLTVQGTSTLIVHQFGEKTRKQFLQKQTKKANTGREAKDPVGDFVRSLYFMDHADPEELIEKINKDKVEPGADVTKYFKGVPLGFPVSGFKNAAVSACRNVEGIPMTLARGAFHIKSIENNLTEISYKKLNLREDNVRLSGKSADLRYRGEFVDWEADLLIELNPNALSQEQLANLIDISGFAVGIGDWRPEKNGSYGMFQVKRGGAK